ncbi:conserved hypothetical protein [Luminiphilus syltensis NOR5-1B]|uniref:Copper chaperone PCu(A)C n=2 Tax=Luminiphilus TaxID=1341118 RepID=B8KW09_9GAMM|nr:conserved hypothetical protein [Luminiphilus syltensis NOR5-1B]
MPPGQAMTAGYGTLTNTGKKTIVITDAMSPIAASTEMHMSKTEGGQVTMVPLEKVVLEPGKAFDLVPGGAHLMLMGIQRMPSESERVSICLITDGSDQFCTDVPVSRSAPQ